MADQSLLIKEGDHYIDLSTTNKSFLKMRQFLKKQGIKNCNFFLRLYDKELQGINIYTIDEKNISKTLKTRIIIEIRKNPWYYFREWYRIPAVGFPVRFILDRGNLAQMYCMLMNLNTIQVKPRQTGKVLPLIAVML